MPRLIEATKSTDASIVRPIVLGMVHEIMKMTGLDKTTQILYPGELEKPVQPGSEISNPDRTEENDLPYNERVTIEVDELFEEDRMNSTATHRMENLPVFMDEDLEIVIKPIYASSDMTINIRYRAADKVSAERWRNEMRARVADAREVKSYTLTYHYVIPLAYIGILAQLHAMREKVAGYGETFEEYLNKYGSQHLTYLTTQGGTTKTLAMAETQGRVQGWFDFPGMPELGSKEDETETWTIGFSFKFKYDKAIAMAMHYPLVVHNQLLPQAFRPAPSDNIYVPENQERQWAMSAAYLNYYEANNEKFNNQYYEGYQVPSFDEFLLWDVPPFTLRVITGMTLISEGDLRSLMSLKDLGDYEFSEDILKFLVTEAPYMTKTNKSIFQLTLYSKHHMVTGNPITINSNLDISATQDLTLRNDYHVRLSIVTNLRVLDRDALDRARDNGAALIEIIKAIDPWLDPSKLPEILIDDFIPKHELDKTIDELDHWNSLNKDRQRTMNTVETFFIRTGRINAISTR